MKKRELSQMREKKTNELVKIVAEKKKELVTVYGRVKVGRETNLKKAKNLRLDIAQILSIIGKKGKE